MCLWWMCLCMCLCVCAWTYVYVYVCAHIYTHMRAHTCVVSVGSVGLPTHEWCYSCSAMYLLPEARFSGHRPRAAPPHHAARSVGGCSPVGPAHWDAGSSGSSDSLVIFKGPGGSAPCLNITVNSTFRLPNISDHNSNTLTCVVQISFQ